MTNAAKESCWAMTGGGAAMLRPFRFQCVGVHTSIYTYSTYTVGHVVLCFDASNIRLASDVT